MWKTFSPISLFIRKDNLKIMEQKIHRSVIKVFCSMVLVILLKFAPCFLVVFSNEQGDRENCLTIFCNYVTAFHSIQYDLKGQYKR